MYYRQDRTPLSPVTITDDLAPPSLAAAYEKMADLANAAPDAWRGWKLGGTNHASRAAFNVDQLYFGAIAREEILNQPDRAPAFALCEMKGEVEIALRLGATGETFDAWCVALEMPSSPITNLPGAGVASLVADRCAAGALLLGPAHEPDSLRGVADAAYTLEIDGAVAGAGTWDDLVASPAECLAEFLALAGELGFSPRPGDWVATGGITPCKPIAEGARVRVLVRDTPALDFTATQGS